jgi:hypothetical protein
MERAAAGCYASRRRAADGGWWSSLRLSLALTGVGVDPPAPADAATEGGKCRSLCTVTALFSIALHIKNIYGRDTVVLTAYGTCPVLFS